MLDENQVNKALQNVLHPKLRKSLVDIGMIRNVTIRGDVVGLTLALKSDHGPLKDKFVRDIEQLLGAIPGVAKVDIDVTSLSREESERLFPQIPLEGIEKIGRFIAVASGKGGVGKTTVAVNLAVALSRIGFRTGLLDADIYGPSVPLMLGLPESLREEGGMILPCEKHGMRIVSLGMTAGETDAFIWRGPLVSKMIRYLLGRVKWGELDFLVIDLPPGTGDPSITIAQAIPQAQILMVTTPQEVSLADVRRSITLFQRHNLQIAGLVENMSYFRCGHSADPIQIFGSGGGEKLSRETGLPLLGAIPFDLELGRSGDSGVPLMLSAPDSETGLVFQQVARAMSRQAKEVRQKTE
ncbi:MAG TPA: chromosome partitioning protein [Desulfobulbaceae bacterium]|nr:chromosome partitioning protein [Desulfobulbaceae bacterium]